jgi:hypothetical protein
MTPSLRLVSEQFPHLREQVACLFERNEIFRELCEDYEACTSALARQPASGALRQEYSALQLRLETELLGYLHEDAEPAARRK